MYCSILVESYFCKLSEVLDSLKPPPILHEYDGYLSLDEPRDYSRMDYLRGSYCEISREGREGLLSLTLRSRSVIFRSDGSMLMVVSLIK